MKKNRDVLWKEEVPQKSRERIPEPIIMPVEPATMDEIFGPDEEVIFDSTYRGLFNYGESLFCYDQYELARDADGDICIQAAYGAELVQYRPFARYPRILTDFLELHLEISPPGLPYSHTYKGEIDPDNEVDIYNCLLLADYASKYGPFGIIKGKDSKGPKDPRDPTYSEKVKDILAEPTIRNIIWHFKHVIEFRKSKATLEDTIRTNYHSNKAIDIVPWEIILSRIAKLEHRLGIYVDSEKGWQLYWFFTNLLGALEIMYLNNLAETMGPVAKKCLLPECKQVFTDNRLYCTPAHATRYRKRLERQRKKLCEKMIGELEAILDNNGKYDGKGEVFKEGRALFDGYLENKQLETLDDIVKSLSDGQMALPRRSKIESLINELKEIIN